MKVQHAYPIDPLKARIRQLGCHIHCAFGDMVMSILPR